MSSSLTAGAGVAQSRPRSISPVTVLLIAALVLAIIGFGVATYLSIVHYTHNEIACNGLGDCEYVNSSKYAEVAGVPVAVMGAIAYATMALFMLAYLFARIPALLQLIWLIGFASFAFSMYLTAIELWVLEAICVYCVVSATVMTALFALQSWLLWLTRESLLE